jgi:four helix bundle protein
MDGPSKSFRDLLVWQKAHAFTLAVYRATDSFPKTETYGLTSQVRRSAGSIPANVVEGFRPRTTADKLRFYNLAQSSADETLYHLILAHDLGYPDTQELQAATEEVSRLLQGYINGLERNQG